jgi:hypothetical protein
VICSSAFLKKVGKEICSLFPNTSSVLHPNIQTRVARFFLVHDTKIGKMYQMNTNVPNGHKKYPKYPEYISNDHKIYQHFPI